MTGRDPSILTGARPQFGMTSLSVRQFIVGIYKQYNLKEQDITKIQTGGPDGDLGSK